MEVMVAASRVLLLMITIDLLSKDSTDKSAPIPTCGIDVFTGCFQPRNQLLKWLKWGMMTACLLYSTMKVQVGSDFSMGRRYLCILCIMVELVVLE